MRISTENYQFQQCCERRWNEFSDIGAGAIRECVDCQRQVMFCQSRADYEKVMLKDYCAAISLPDGLLSEYEDMPVAAGKLLPQPSHIH